MIEYHRGKFGVLMSWRNWVFGVILGPEVWELQIGPLEFWFDPEGINDPGGRDDAE